MSLPIPPEHLPALVAALRADGVAWLNVGRLPNVGPGADPRPVSVWGALADATCDGRCDPSTGAFKHRPDCTGKPIHTLTVIDPASFSTSGGESVSVDVVVAELVPVAGSADWLARIEVVS